MKRAGRQISRREFLSSAVCAGAAAALARADQPDGAGEHEAAHYERLPDGTVQCRLCPRQCLVPPQDRGYCGARENTGEKYVSLNYGRACAENLDPIEKKPFFHVFPGAQSFSIAAVGCNITCKFCQNWQISRASPSDVKVPYRAPEQIAETAAAKGAKTVAYTYGEPVVFYEYMRDCARACRNAGIDNLMVSNGYIEEKPLLELLPLLKAVKIDLKAFTDSFYFDVCDGELKPVLATLKRITAASVWLEIVALLIPTLNDSPDEIKSMAEWIAAELGPDVPVHFSRYHPAYKMLNIPPTPIATLTRARETAMSQGCRFVYIGNAPGVEGQNTFCPACGTELIRRHVYHVTAMNIKNGECPKCGERIPGIWR